MANITVNLLPRDAADIIKGYVLNEGMSTECVGAYGNITPDGREAIMLVFEKYFMRTSSRASLSIIIENLSGPTRVYSAGSGGGKSALFSFDWGAGDSFSNLVERSLKNYIIY